MTAGESPGVGGFNAADLSDLWFVVIDTEQGLELEQELRREAPDGHVLRGREVRAIAMRKLMKEVLYWLPAEERWAVVHLTWYAETNPSFPTTVMCNSWHEVLAELADRGRP